MSDASEPLYIGIKGNVLAIDRATGSTIWRTPLTSFWGVTGSSYVTLYSDGSGLYAASNGELVCLDRATGSVLWRNNLEGLGYNVITFSGGDTIAAIADQVAKKQMVATAALLATTAARS